MTALHVSADGRSQTIFVNGRVIRYRKDQVGNDLTAELGWCETHQEPVWIFNDGSHVCPVDLAAGYTSPEEHIIVPPPWETA